MEDNSEECLWDCIEPFEEDDQESEGETAEPDEEVPRREQLNHEEI
jgi:hypothetical protein